MRSSAPGVTGADRLRNQELLQHVPTSCWLWPHCALGSRPDRLMENGRRSVGPLKVVAGSPCACGPHCGAKREG